MLAGDCRSAAVLATVSLLYPIFLLSSLEANSVFVPLSLPILRSLISCWWGWLTFYALAALLGGSWLGLLLAGLPSFPFLTALACGPLLAAVLLIVSRLLGRLAWRAALLEAADVEG